MTEPGLGERFNEALAYAATLHRSQTRKGKTTPYIAHLLRVTARVIANGVDEDVAIAALLHDAVEDQGGPETRTEIAKRFGGRVASIVDRLSDTDEEPKPPWKARKEAYLAHLRTEPDREVLLVSLADKLDNVEELLEDFRNEGHDTWARFTTGDPKEQLWYYTSLRDLFKEQLPGPLTDRFSDAVDKLVAEVERR